MRHLGLAPLENPHLVCDVTDQQRRHAGGDSRKSAHPSGRRLGVSPLVAGFQQVGVLGVGQQVGVVEVVVLVRSVEV